MAFVLLVLPFCPSGATALRLKLPHNCVNILLNIPSRRPHAGNNRPATFSHIAKNCVRFTRVTLEPIVWKHAASLGK